MQTRPPFGPMEELSHLEGIAAPRPGVGLLRAPLTRRRCLDYYVLATLEELPEGSRERDTRTVREDAGFVPWTLRDARNALDWHDPTVEDALSRHGDGAGGFDVWEPLARHADRANAKTWVTTSYDHPSLGQDLGELTIVVLDLIPHFRPGRPRMRIPLESLALVARRCFARAGLGDHVRRTRERLAAGRIREFRYELIEVAVLPGQPVRLLRAAATTRPGAPRGYRDGEVQRGLIAPPR